jgi:transcriptional regulator with XRE-family HTH domain
MSMTTAKNLNRLVELTGVTHEELGRIADVTRSAVSHWMSGMTEPRMGAIQRIADHYGIRKSCLIEINGMDNVHVDSMGRLYECIDTKNDLPKTAEELISNYKKLSETEQDVILGLIRTMVERRNGMVIFKKDK